MELQRKKILEALGCVFLLAIYMATLPPSLTWAHYGADGGDLITAVARGSLPHPPGYPIYPIIAQLFFAIPWGDPAWRLNLLSAVATTIASGFIIAIVRRWHDSITAIGVGLAFGLAPLVWSQAIIIEVYALAIGFASVILFLLFIDAPIWLVGFVWGIGLGAHPIIVLFVPLIVWRAWQNRAYGLAQITLCAFVGWDIAFGPLMLMRGDVPSPWGSVRTLDGWWAYASAQIYHGYMFGVPGNAVMPRVLTLLDTLMRQFTPVGATIAIIGWGKLWQKRRAFSIASVITVGAISAFAVFYNTIDSMVYLIFAMPLVALWLARGLSQVAAWLHERWRWGSALILLLPLIQLIFFWNEMDLHANHTAMNWAERVLSSAPPHAILDTAQDEHTFTLWYAHDVLHARPDVSVVDRDLWGFESYRKTMADTLGTDISLDSIARETQRPLIDVEAEP